MTANEFSDLIGEKFHSLHAFMQSLEGYNFDAERVMAYKLLYDNKIIFIANQDKDVSNSYSYTDEDLERIYQHVPSGNYFMIEGKNQSYGGTSWYGIKNVNIKTNTIVTYE